MQGDRREIITFHGAANGQVASPSESRKKRRREDERSDRGGRSRPFGNSGSSPFSGLGENTLRSASRSIPGESRSVMSISTSSTPSKSQTHHASLAQVAFPTRPNDSKGRLPKAPNTTQSFTFIEDEGDFNGKLSSHTTDQHFPRPSDDVNRRMDGSNEKTLPMAVWFGCAPSSSGSPHPAAVESPALHSSDHERSSSVDPIDVISEKTPHTDRRPKRSERKPAPVEHITIEDDEDEKVIEVMIQPARRAGTPTGQTRFREGHVKEATARHDSMTQQSLNSYLPSRPGSTAAPAKRTSLPTSKPGPSSKSSPTVIVPGSTRHSGIARGMKNKNGLKIEKTGAEAKAQLPASALRAIGSRSPPSKSTVAPFEELTLNVQEWYCGGKKYGDGKTVWPGHTFHCGPGSMVSLRATQSGPSPLVLLSSDIEGFEIAESVHKNPDVEEFVPALRFTVTGTCANSSAWARVSDGDNYPYALVVLDLGDGPDENNWRQLVNRVAKFAKKNIVNAQAMNNLIKQARSQSHKSNYRSGRKLGELAQDDTKQLPPVVPPTMSGPSTRTRNRVATAQPKGEHSATQLLELPPEDPDEIMLVYPSTGPGAVNINRAELLRLGDNEFLNDTLIELGLKLWLNDLREKHPEFVEQVHVFNSFFFKKLDGGRGKNCDYNSVKKWTSKIDLFKKRFIIVPINEHLHWYLAIIFLPEHALHAPPPQPAPQPTRKTRSSNVGATKEDEPRASQESDIPPTEKNSIIDLEIGSPTELGRMEIDTDLANRSQHSMVLDDVDMASLTTDADAKPAERSITPVVDVEEDMSGFEDQNNIDAQKCWILIFDSLKGKHARTIRILREYLQAEAQEKHGKLIETKDAKLSGGFIEDKHLPVPEQPNWCDCGVYLLHYVEAFVANPLALLAVPGLRRKSPPDEVARYKELWRTDDVVQKRDTFRKQVNKLSDTWRQSRSQPTQVSKDSLLITGELAPDTGIAPPLQNVVGDLSIVEIQPPSTRILSNEPPTLVEPEEPLRTGELPPMPGDYQLLPPSLLHPSPEQDQELSTTETSSLVNDAGNSEGSPSASGHKIRRGKKGGERHGGSGWHLKPSQVSQASQTSEISQFSQPIDVSETPGSPEL